MNREYLLAQMKHSELQALWWIASATIGHAEIRDIRKGGHDGQRLTPQELRDDAMTTAQTHITNYRNFSEALLKSTAK